MAKRGIFVAPFDELADARLLAELAARAEQAGWDGFFVWDHVNYRPPVSALADPWIALAAIACETERVVIGPMITPPARRRIHKLARETVTLDHLSRGRLIFGAGLGSDNSGEFSQFGEEADARTRAQLLDDGLVKLIDYWNGEFEPRPLQQPRIPVWLAARWPNRKPLRRAAHWDGVFPIDLNSPDELAEIVDFVHAERPDPTAPYDVVVENPAGGDPAPWEAAGATWCLTSFGNQPKSAEVGAAIDTIA
jgi:alkanesulfonate monooxygenase SsuD/methylene tetrahydromethanopterin reductase-like flavin-dependent oxidoreductase (luciferase family)